LGQEESGLTVQAIIYVIDSSDASRLATSRSELLTMLSEDELKSVPVLVFANKQDVEGALSPAEISDKLGLAGGEKGREWSVRGSCATKGDGLEDGLDWCVHLIAVRGCGADGQACQHDTEVIKLGRGDSAGQARKVVWDVSKASGMCSISFISWHIEFFMKQQYSTSVVCSPHSSRRSVGRRK
jgi:hypothetical protein